MRVFENTTYQLVGLGLVDIDVDEHDLEASDIPETIPNRPLLKIGYKTFAMYVFENMSYPLVGLDLVDVVNVDGHDLGGL